MSKTNIIQRWYDFRYAFTRIVILEHLLVRWIIWDNIIILYSASRTYGVTFSRAKWVRFRQSLNGMRRKMPRAHYTHVCTYVHNLYYDHRIFNIGRYGTFIQSGNNDFPCRTLYSDSKVESKSESSSMLLWYVYR